MYYVYRYILFQKAKGRFFFSLPLLLSSSLRWFSFLPSCMTSTWEVLLKAHCGGKEIINYMVLQGWRLAVWNKGDSVNQTLWFYDSVTKEEKKLLSILKKYCFLAPRCKMLISGRSFVPEKAQWSLRALLALFFFLYKFENGLSFGLVKPK